MKVASILCLLFSSVNIIQSKSVIKNINLPSCKNCVHFQPYNSGFEFTSSLGTCNKFGVKNILTDKIKYDYADACRQDENQCGKEGKYFEEEKNLHLKMFTHKIIAFSPLILFFFCITVLLIPLNNF